MRNRRTKCSLGVKQQSIAHSIPNWCLYFNLLWIYFVSLPYLNEASEFEKTSVFV
jgi:hypothetical protein